MHVTQRAAFEPLKEGSSPATSRLQAFRSVILIIAMALLSL